METSKAAVDNIIYEYTKNTEYSTNISLDNRAHDITIAYLTRYGIKGEFMSDPSAWAFTSKYSLAYQTVVAKLRQMDFKPAEGKGGKA